MELKKEEILKVVNLLDSGTQKDSYISGSDTILFKEHSASTFNGAVSVSVVIDTGLIGAIKADQFKKILSKLPEESFNVEVLENSWEITCGKMKASMVLQEPGIEKHIGGMKLFELEFKQLPKNFIDGVKLCLISGNSFSKKGVIVKDKLLMNTDGARLNYFTLDEGMDFFWMDDVSSASLVKLQTPVDEYCTDSVWGHFRDPSGIIFSMKLLDTSICPVVKMEHYRDDYMEKTKGESQRLPKALINVLDRSSVFYTDVKGYQAIKMDVFKTHAKVSSASDIGKIEEEIDWEKPFDGDISFSFLTDYSFLKEAVQKCPEFYMLEDNGGIFVIFKNENFIQILRTIDKN